MSTSSITERLHAKADADLKARLNESVEWVWTETGHNSGRPEPKVEEFPELASNYTNAGEPAPQRMPWIGRILQLFKIVAFAYLRDKWRDKYVAEFMAKVEAMAGEMESLGLVVQANSQE